MRMRLLAVTALSAVATAAGASLVAVAAFAAPVPETGNPGLLSLHATPYPAQGIQISPGQRLYWPITAELDAPTTGELSVRVVSADPLAAALRFRFASCPEPWQVGSLDGPATCAAGESVVIADAVFAETDADTVWQLGDIRPDQPRHFLVSLTLPSGTDPQLAQESATVSFGFTARDDSGGGAGGGLADTGRGVLGPLLLGGGLLAGGLALARLRRGEVTA